MMKLSIVEDIRQAIIDEEIRAESLRACERVILTALEYLPPTSPTRSNIAQFIAQIKDSERRLEILRDKYNCATVQCADEIYRRVKGVSADVLFQRYVLSKSFSEIAASLHYCTTNIYRLHRQAKNEFYGQKSP